MAEPLGKKSIECVPGIGPVLGNRLAEAGYDKVSSSLLLLLFLKKPSLFSPSCL
jgi:hypothetical protein